MRKITGLYIYPVKSLRGTSLQSSELDTRGLVHDRAWMIVDQTGKFVTQRQFPAMAKIMATLEPEEGLVLGTTDTIWTHIPSDEWTTGERVTVRIWDDEECEAIDQGSWVAKLLSAVLGANLRLVYMPPDFHRPSRRLDPGSQVDVGFADGYPLLVSSEESLADLNGRMETPLPMDRFRPNIVVSGCATPFEEDEWHSFTAGGISFRGMKLCKRCEITQTDQLTGEIASKEPLATLAKYRRIGKGVCFGLNANHLGTGTLRVGDAVEVQKFALPRIE